MTTTSPESKEKIEGFEPHVSWLAEQISSGEISGIDAFWGHPDDQLFGAMTVRYLC